MFFSSDKAVRVLGYRPRPAVDALNDAVDWYRDNGFLPATLAAKPATAESP